jgi:pyroglutamyl-peptidase
MRILITAFEPFGGAETNITQSILSLLPDSFADWAIEKVCLPVSFKRAPIMLREAIATYSPDLVIMLVLLLTDKVQKVLTQTLFRE